MFYDYTAEVYKREIIVNEYGEEEAGELKLIATISGDLQPYSSEKLKSDYGLIEQVTNVFYCDPIDLDGDIILKINGKSFEVKTVVGWGSHYEVTLWQVQ